MVDSGRSKCFYTTSSQKWVRCGMAGGAIQTICYCFGFHILAICGLLWVASHSFFVPASGYHRVQWVVYKLYTFPISSNKTGNDKTKATHCAILSSTDRANVLASQIAALNLCGSFKPPKGSIPSRPATGLLLSKVLTYHQKIPIFANQ